MANKSSRLVWAYQATLDTPVIIAAGSTNFHFGKFSDETGKWDTPTFQHDVSPFYIYSTKTPNSLDDLDKEFKNIKITFHPTTAQHLAWILKQPSDAATDTITALEGISLPLEIRLEQIGGTAPRMWQATDCFCVSMYSRAMLGSPLLVSNEFVWGSFYDQDDYDPLTAGNSTLAGGNDVTIPYDGRPQVVWNSNPILECWKAEWRVTQDSKSVSTSDTKQENYLYTYKPVDITLNCIFKTDFIWDDFNVRTARNLLITTWKPDMTTNIINTFTNCKVVNIIETGIRNKGHYEAIVIIKAEKIEATFVRDGATDWDIHYKHVA